MVSLLLEHGADVNLSDMHWEGDETALQIACERGLTDIARVLLEAGASVNFGQGHAHSMICPLNLTCDSRKVTLSLALVELLLEYKADVNHVCPSQYKTPLMSVVKNSYMNKNTAAVMKLLISHGADIRQKLPSGETLLDAAIVSGCAATRLLLEKGADPNARNAHGETPLQHMCRWHFPFLNAPGGYVPDGEWADIARVLQEFGAEVEASDDDGLTPLLETVIYYDLPEIRRELVRFQSKVLPQYE
jgi:ankyrin repeat protein